VETRYLIQRVSQYSFVPDGEKDLLEGCKILALDLDLKEVSGNAIGLEPIEIQADLTVFGQFRADQVPGYYDLSIKHKPRKDKKGKTMLVMHAVSVMYVGGVDLGLKAVAKS